MIIVSSCEAVCAVLFIQSVPSSGYLIDKFGQYKFVMVLTLILNAAFHHSLLLIPHMETPGEMPSAYVMKHPETGQFQVG